EERPAAGRLQRRDDSPDSEEDTGQVDVEDALPLGEFVVLDRADVDDAGVVDQNVDTAEFVDRGGHHALPVAGRGDVKMHVTRCGANVFGDGLAFGVEDVAEDHFGPLVDQGAN